MYGKVKRCIDIAVSGPACLLLLPAVALITVCICLETPGPPLFMQRRVGLYGRPFILLKFRSMVKDAPSLGSPRTEKNDARITRVGRFLRATSLDELPQLWNVLIGDMSLIGPRPELPIEESLYRPEDWKLRHLVRPGITGLAQVNGRSHTTPEERLHYDLEYAAHSSFGKDIGILLKTALVVMRAAGTN